MAVEAAIIIAVAAYFVVEGLSGNIALSVVLGLLGVTSVAMFLGALFEGRAQRQ